MESFERDHTRYHILKRRDVNMLGNDDKRLLEHVLHRLSIIRKERGQDITVLAVVIEHDWPEYETAWAMIEAREKKYSVCREWAKRIITCGKLDTIVDIKTLGPILEEIYDSKLK